MKRLILISVIFVNSIVSAQEKPPIRFTEVIKVDSADKAELFARARYWFNTAFRSSKEVLNIVDKETGELSGKGLIQFNSRIFMGSAATKGVIRFMVSIQVKDGRYKYEITDFMHESTTVGTIPYSFGIITDDEECPYKMQMTSKKWKNNLWKELQDRSREEGRAIALSIEKSMSAPSSNNQNW